jgi:4-phospho-D-threonate 3-dehydrogenase / 4-phospho-D-erythronate 3-dehydrogenase
MKEHNSILAITMGDPAGCGPEVVAMAFTSGRIHPYAKLVCIGDAEVMRRAFGIIGAKVKVEAIRSISDASFKPSVLSVLDLNNIDLKSLKWGVVQAVGGQAAYDYIVRSIDLALVGDVDAVVTAPINKEALHLAGHNFDGHTEIFAKRTGTKSVTMMLASGHFRVTHVSTHVSLRKAIERCTRDRILRVVELTHDGLIRMGIDKPRLAVAGLNPHSGEGGIFGSEEAEIIQPAIDSAISHGMDICPYPVPPDTVFVQMQERKVFDAVVAQYHDQGHIAAKLVDFWGGVNITLGIPIIRTSVDHGTAYDIAGLGKANPESMINAIEYAYTMHENWPARTRL